MSVNNTDDTMSKPLIPITIAYLVGLIAGSVFNYFPITVVAAIIVFTIAEAILYKPYNYLPTDNSSVSPFSKGGWGDFQLQVNFWISI